LRETLIKKPQSDRDEMIARAKVQPKEAIAGMHRSRKETPFRLKVVGHNNRAVMSEQSKQASREENRVLSFNTSPLNSSAGLIPDRRAKPNMRKTQKELTS
jgi:hypothetical protein